MLFVYLFKIIKLKFDFYDINFTSDREILERLHHHVLQMLNPCKCWNIFSSICKVWQFFMLLM